jgi:RNA polymerase sigma-70 factor (ECF subfamily)
VRYPKAFLFTAARNAAFDLFRRRRARPTEAVTELVALTVLEERPEVGEQLDQSYELEVLADAVPRPPAACVIRRRFSSPPRAMSPSISSAAAARSRPRP